MYAPRYLLATIALASAFAIADEPVCQGRNDLPRVLEHVCYSGQPDATSCPYHDDAFGIFENNRAPYHYLLVPRQKVCGIENEALWQSGTHDWFAEAWRLRHLFAEAKPVSGGVPLERVGIAINSIPGRSQGQLHVHISCVEQGVAKQLAVHASQFNDTWQPLDLTTPDGVQHYLARRLAGPQIDPDVFASLAKAHPELAADKGNITAFAASVADGSVIRPLVLIGHYSDHNQGHAEDLLDGCGNVQAAPKPQQ
ncbi:CDP-diacylglycerol pyrophosphatase [Silvimonas terrae]|uniref:CDP-diacylglycerol pyrophosphatase n=1 Tax=Silvimonas terrae TaxID=300266 RepID=A0A840RMG4_9NEIS|nr:CDP-diacylglycerol diphosphatase [Silvimonas terrae]MBB5193363.1 CDP-diacylglycerol pyrophosphatase [Silvimonas terrae]